MIGTVRIHRRPTLFWRAPARHGDLLSPPLSTTQTLPDDGSNYPERAASNCGVAAVRLSPRRQAAIMNLGTTGSR